MALLPDRHAASTGRLPPRALLYAMAAQLPMLAWQTRDTPALWAVLAGGALALAAATLNVWSDLLFRRHGAGVCPFSRVRELVIRAPYRLTRNSMYVGLVLIALAPVVAFALPANLFAPVALAMWLHFRLVLPEESFLRERFAEAFDAYAAHVPRWLIALPDVRLRPE